MGCVLQHRHPALALVFRLAVQHALLVSVVLAGAHVLVGDLEPEVSLHLHIVVPESLDNRPGQEDDSYDGPATIDQSDR